MASMIKRLWNDRRGVSAWVVTVAMVPLLGMVSLGTEVGSWHVTRRHAQNAADAAAFAGATALAVNDPTGPVTAGQAFAKSNGFVSGGAQTVSITPAGNRVTAVITQNEKPIFTQWFVPAGPVKIQATAVAEVQTKPGYCMLALNSLDMSGNFNFSGGCGLASNGTFDPPPPGQNPFLGDARDWSLNVQGNCNGNANKCDLSGKVNPYSYNTGTPVPLPPALDHLMNSGVVPTEPTGNIAKNCPPPSPPPSPSMTWQDYRCISGPLAPGLYMFRKLDVVGTVSGTGVNIIIGSGGLGGSGSMNLTAGNGGGLSDMKDVLILDLEGKGASKTPDIKFTGQYTSNFNGAIYFPYAHLTFRGGSGLTGCMVVVAKVLDFGGNSSMDLSGCSDSVLQNDVSQKNIVMLTQ